MNNAICFFLIYVQISKEDGVLVVEINRPEVRNCVNQQTASELYRLFYSYDIYKPPQG